jgi:GDPmannose 4,6-dehydratase
MSAAASSGSARNKIALITGITGQDGSYLAEFLLQKVGASPTSSL